MRKISLHRIADKFLATLPPKHAAQLTRKLNQLLVEPLPHDAKKMMGVENDYWRVDAGEYRIIYHYDDALIPIDVIGKRNDDAVYKQFKLKH